MIMQRKLTAIFSADVQGYSRLMGENEEVTIRILTVYRDIMTQFVQQHRGRVVDAAGDNLLAEFASVVDAVQCAIATQRALQARNTELPADRAMAFRIGINLGDVVVEGDRIYGDGVNLAARLEGLAEGGGICISGTVYDQVETKLDLRYVSLGERTLKNFAKPVRVYRIGLEPQSSALVVCRRRRPVPAQWLKRTWTSAGRRLKGLARMVRRRRGASRLLSPHAPRRAEAHRAVARLHRPAIVVLPFDHLSGDPEPEGLSAGITEVLVTDLTKLTGTLVITRNHTWPYPGEPVSPHQLCQETGAQYVLKGSVRTADQRVRIIARLLDATSGHHLWADRYDRDLHDIFALQDEIAQQIVAGLAVTLGPGAAPPEVRSARADWLCGAAALG